MTEARGRKVPAKTGAPGAKRAAVSTGRPPSGGGARPAGGARSGSGPGRGGSGRPPARRPGGGGGGSRARRSTIVVALVVVLVLAGALALALGTTSTSSKSAAPFTVGTAADAVVAKATSVPASVFDQVGAGTALAQPKAISGPALVSGAKPEMLYIGAEYCPYCAAERWAMVMALSRFGTLSGVGLTASSAIDVHPNTPTFTFRDATYTSQYLVFTPVETETNQPVSGGGYQPLDTPTAAQTQLLDSLGGGSFPFVDFGGKYLISGATYDAGVLAGKTAAQVADLLADPTSPVTRAAVGAANGITAAICQMTGGQPAAVCQSAAVTAVAPSLGATGA